MPGRLWERPGRDCSGGMRDCTPDLGVPQWQHCHDVTVSVGSSAQAFGQQVGSVGKNIFEQKFTRITPPGTRLCTY
jgi:hypothetical protein